MSTYFYSNVIWLQSGPRMSTLHMRQNIEGSKKFLYSKAFDSILKVIRGQIEEKKSEKEQNMTGSQSMSYDGKYIYTN